MQRAKGTARPVPAPSLESAETGEPTPAFDVGKSPTHCPGIFPARIGGALPISTLFTIRHNLIEDQNGRQHVLDRALPSKRFRSTDPGGIMSATSEMLNEIKEVNLSYLLLAQRLLREDKPMGMFRMGISDGLADVLANLSFAQTVKLAASSQLLCRFRFDDHAVLSSLADKIKAGSLAQSHSAILLASESVESIN